MMLGIVKRSTALAALLSLPCPGLSTNEGLNHTDSTGFPPCDALISAGLGHRVLLATSDSYEPRIQSWWSAKTRLRPWCLVQPYTTQEVSTAVSALSDSGLGAGDWHIAVRGGGHGPAGSNNIANGVTIDLGMMNSSHYDSERDLARVEPGAAWKDVYYDLLHSANVTATGGRDGDVGVGGYLLGGGMSYYTYNNGFGCDQVVNFEVVLADGSIVNANCDEHSDLWKALKGGGLNFGIVTAFDLRVMRAVDIAYGQNIIASDHSDEVIDAVVEFTNHPEELSDDALIALFTHDPEIGGKGDDDDITIILIRTNARGNLSTGSFDTINEIPTLTNRTWDLKSHADAASDSQIPAGSYTAQRTLTLPNNPEILQRLATLHQDLVSTLTHSLPPSFATKFILQPFPSYLSTHDNILGLDDTLTANSILFDAGITTTSATTIALAEVELSRLITALESFTSKNDASWDPQTSFVYTNYASPAQNPLASYGGRNVEFMREVAERYDAGGFWQDRVPGGFKIGRVGGTE